jgi:hypothetical protein
MTLRRPIIALFVAILGSPAAAHAANFTTANFSVEAPSPELARKFGEWAEYYRKEKAREWLGQEMPQWSTPCPLQVQITMGSASGATTFNFGADNTGRSTVMSRQMEIRGEVKQLIYSVLPHEITHTVFAHHFGRAVPRWADEGGSVLSENDEERYKHDVSCRELLNAGRCIRLPILFRMVKYPSDMFVLYAQGYSVCAYLVDKGGGGREGRAKLLQFVAMGMQGNDPNHHGSIETWNDAARKVYGFENIDNLESSWIQALRTPPSRVAARDVGNTGSSPKNPTVAISTSTPAAGNRVELRSSAAPLPMLDPPVKARAAAPDFDSSRNDSYRPTHLPAIDAVPTPAPTFPGLPPAPASPVAAIPTSRSAPSDIPLPQLLPPQFPARQ